jgi:CRP/FNR family transcriptional regulator
MATAALTPELASMEMFRTSLIRDSGSRETAERLCAVGRFSSLSRGSMLWQNPDSDRLVYIASGAVKLIGQRAGPDDSDANANERSARGSQILAFHFSGEIVSVLHQAERDVRLAALCDTDLVIFWTDQFLDVAEGDPSVIRAVLTRSLEALQRSRARMMQLGHKSARQRVADFLVTLAQRIGTMDGGACDITLPMSRRDIAESLGLTLETVSRQFAELRSEGLVATSGRSGVRLPDLHALAREAGQRFS